jgi:hypothetical protein
LWTNREQVDLMPTVAAPIGTTDWLLTGIRNSVDGTECDHCGRRLKNLYSVANQVTGRSMTVGRGCCTQVTGWNLTTAEATRILRIAEAAARQEANWKAFTEAHPEAAAQIEADIAEWSTRHPGATYAGPPQELRIEIKAGSPARWDYLLTRYMARMH